MKTVRILTSIVAGFIALTAIGGGFAILLGVDDFPLEWLDGTPFRDYTIPALILALVVGGSALWATVAVAMRKRTAPMAAMVAGAIMAGFIVVEVWILKQEPPGPTVTEIVYFVLGALLLGLGYLLRSQRNGG